MSMSGVGLTYTMGEENGWLSRSQMQMGMLYIDPD